MNLPDMRGYLLSTYFRHVDEFNNSLNLLLNCLELMISLHTNSSEAINITTIHPWGFILNIANK